MITGVGGYVGSALANQFIDVGHHVAGFGYDENFSILKKRFGEKITLVTGDITEEKKLLEVFHDADVVIHTASPTTEKFCVEKPWEAYQAIVLGTRAVASAVRELKIPLLIHFSTQAVYMNFHARELPLTEEMEPKPDTVYGALKRAAELELADMPTVILRPANIYGRNPLGIDRENVIARFVKAVKTSKPLTIKGDGLQRADFVHLRDVVSAAEKILMSESPESIPMVYNVGSGVSHSIQEIADMVISIAKEKRLLIPSITYREHNDRIAADRVLSPKRVQAVLPQFPRVSFEEGMRELFD